MKKKKRQINDVVVDEATILDIDLLRLEEEWANQPHIYYKYSKKLAVKQRKLDEAKDFLKYEEARLQKDMREFPDQYGIRKVTDKAIEGYVILQEDYREALRQYNEAKYQVGLLNAMCEALEHRKKALEKESELFVAQYWSKPKAPKGAREEFEFADATKAFGTGRKRE